MVKIGVHLRKLLHIKTVLPFLEHYV